MPIAMTIVRLLPQRITTVVRQLPHPFVIIVSAVVAISILMFIMTQLGAPATRLISYWQPQPVMVKPDLPSKPTALAPPVITGRVAPADLFDLRVDDGLYTNERAILIGELQTTFAYVSSRFGSVTQRRFTVTFSDDDSCGLHGLALTDQRIVQVYTCSNIGRDRAIAIMAHEMVHQLEQDRYGLPHLNADLILSEGMATWGAGKYWLGNQPDFRTYVRSQRQRGVAYPLATDYAGLGITAMNALYYEWASFVDYLITTYGREKFDHLYITGHNRPGSADYIGTYGKGLDVLEHEWSAWIDG